MLKIHHIPITEEQLSGGEEWVKTHRSTNIVETPLWVFISLGGSGNTERKRGEGMTRDVAIKILKTMKPTPCRGDGKSTTHILQTIALEMAIKALEDKDVLDKIRAEIKEWYWQADKQALAKDPCVVDAMIDLFIRTIDKYKAEMEE